MGSGAPRAGGRIIDAYTDYQLPRQLPITLLTLDYLCVEPAEVQREEFEAFLAAVPDVEPVEMARVE